jgi:hypothetical protein
VEESKFTKNDKVMERTRKRAGRERRKWMFEIKVDVKTRDKTLREVTYVPLLRDKI